MLAPEFARLIQPEVQEFIFSNERTDERDLVLRHKTILDLPASLIAQQLAGRRKAKHKLPLWYTTRGIIYPPSLHIEQSSSEATAAYKASLLSNGNKGVDLTGGLGVDSFYLAKKMNHFTYVEPDTTLLELVRHNHQVLGAVNIAYVNSTAEQFLEQVNSHFDLIYIDPSRRSKEQKVFKLSDCVPNVVELMPLFMDKADVLLIKNSPLLDIQQGLQELKYRGEVKVVATDNECKELLYFFQKRNEQDAIEAVDLSDDGTILRSFSFTREEEKASPISIHAPMEWLYEPGASVLKAGAFRLLCSRYAVSKLDVNTHLYTSAERIVSFPGRTFKAVQRVKMDSSVKSLFPSGYANILTRNYPMSVEEIKKKTGLKEGGTRYLICTQGEKQKHVILAERVD